MVWYTQRGKDLKVLFIDYLSRIKRDMIIRKMTKDARIDRDG